VTTLAAGRKDIADIPAYCADLADAAVKAGRALVRTSGLARANALLKISERLVAATDEIVEANKLDLQTGRDMGLTDAKLERLTLTPSRIEAMADSVRQIAGQTDPIGEVIEGYVRPSGIRLEKVRVPIGVVLFIYESRPNVTTDAAALCIKSGNAIILRGGKEALHSNTATSRIIRDSLADAGLDPNAVQLVQTTDRSAVGELLKMEGRIDLCIPRGGESLIRAVVEQARIPVIKHYTGNCHVYVDEHVDADMAVNICDNAKTQRVSVCNSAETILVHRDHVRTGVLDRICKRLTEKGVHIRGDEAVRDICAAAAPASDADWSTEYLDLIVAMKVVDSLDDAIDHINTYGSKHTDAIVTTDVDAADRFALEVDSADVFINCSTRFSDGGEYGLGAEIGISTDKLHARGPMGARDMTTYKWIARGNGQVR